MAGLVRGVSEEMGRALKERTEAHGRSMDEEHREILAAALLLKTRKRSFADVLASMPDVGRDAGFERVQSSKHAPTSWQASWIGANLYEPLFAVPCLQSCRARSLNQAHETTHNANRVIDV